MNKKRPDATESDATSPTRARASGGRRPDCRDEAAARVWQLVTARLRGSGLTVGTLAGGLVVTNPADRDAGRVHVAYADGYVCRERVLWDYWGYLEGLRADATVSVEAIARVLTGRT